MYMCERVCLRVCVCVCVRACVSSCCRKRMFVCVCLYVTTRRQSLVTLRDVSDQAFLSLSNFYFVIRCAFGGRPGNKLPNSH